MKSYLNRHNKATIVQQIMLVLINSTVLMLFNFNKTFANDARGIVSATVTVTIPLIMNVYKDNKQFTAIKQSFNSLKAKIKQSLISALIIFLTFVFEWTIERLIRVTTYVTFNDMPGFISSYLINIFFHGVQLYISYLNLIIGLSLLLEPWFYTILFAIDKKL